MADNVTLNPGAAGAVLGSDEIASVQYQRVKMKLGADGIDDGDIASGNPMPTQAFTRATGGGTAFRLISAATTNATNIKGSAGTLLYITATNSNSAVRFLKIYNVAGSPVVGTDTPIFTFAIPGNTDTSGFAINLMPFGAAFGTGIAMATTTGVADADTGAVAANEIIVNGTFA